MESFKEFQKTFDAIMDNKTVQMVLVILIAIFLVKLLKYIIRRSLKKNVTSRSETLIRVMGKLVAFVIYFFAILQIFQIQFNIQPASLLAATGVVSVAFGFGAQSLVKDIISGFFLLFEDQISVGDLVTIEGFTGVIYEMTLRTTIIRNVYGDLYTIPNGSITKVTNHSRCERGVAVEVSVSYEDDINQAMQVMQNVGKRAKEEIKSITKQPEVLGVTSLADSGITIRMFINCEVGEQFFVEREMLRRIKYAFDEHDVNIPYHHIVIVNQNKKEE